MEIYIYIVASHIDLRIHILTKHFVAPGRDIVAEQMEKENGGRCRREGGKDGEEGKWESCVFTGENIGSD